ncbi:cytochrome c3 family protein [Anaeromyxobacter diazotrophicus]|uniref:Cytochrome c n=1 Tax=Anaeromyxobacter diazotrophicus TaxID=2590199 RepID=A0A7I9VKZ8_9BACT|nr:cytochrome c3 family protein [Anaeromyxobacter diazotrophicus]GEJ57082.1 cytochrome c [Anaeromyxobacter diazotrophicus]
MKLLKITFAAVFALAFGNAYAFHSGGVGECEGCHTMHNSFEGAKMTPKGGTILQSGIYLLKASDQSSACLNCHEGPLDRPSSYHIATPDSLMVGDSVPGTLLTSAQVPQTQTPGGDFGWVKKTLNFKVRGALTSIEGDRHGHNIVAADYGYNKDAIQTVAPGGTFPRENLACSSCHDPHGRYRRDATGAIATTGLPIFNSGSYNTSAAPVAGKGAVGVYRLLAGKNYQPKSFSGTGSFAFANDPPAAVVAGNYNASEGTDGSALVRVAYGQGMAEWCANCHGGMLENGYTSGMPGLVHPAGNLAKLPSFIVTNYNSYVTSGIMTGAQATAYTTLVPFELGTNDYTALAAAVASPKFGADTTNAPNVICLSCHRAHASAFESMTRYSIYNEFMTIADASGNAIYDPSTADGKINMGLDQTALQVAYYGRAATAFGPYARGLCNKCHAKD